eukprot:1358077-Rhodomonas_salina.1
MIPLSLGVESGGKRPNSGIPVREDRRWGLSDVEIVDDVEKLRVPPCPAAPRPAGMPWSVYRRDRQIVLVLSEPKTNPHALPWKRGIKSHGGQTDSPLINVWAVLNDVPDV